MDIEIDWEDVEQIMNELITKKISLVDGLSFLDQKLFERAGFTILKKLDTKRLEKEFNKSISKVLSEESVPSQIKSLHFGIFVMSDPAYNKGDDVTTVCFTGSSFTPDESVDWACWDENSFLPRSKYFIFTDFSMLDKLLKNKKLDGNFEVLLYNGVLALLIINFIGKYSKSLLDNSNNTFIYVGVGSDSGTNFILGKITNNGFI